MRGYSGIQKIVDEFISSIGVRTILTRHHIVNYLTILYYNWEGADGKYYSLLVPCSTAQIYEAPSLRLVSCSSLQDKLQKNLRVFDSKTEWDHGKWNSDDVDACQDSIKTLQKRIVSPNICYGGYRLVSTELHLQPEIGFTVWYEKERLECVTFWLGAVTTVISPDTYLADFFKAIGISDFVRVVSVPHTSNFLLEER